MSKNRDRAWRRSQRDRYIQRRSDRYPTERRLPGEARLWQCHTPDGTPINLFHREQKFGAWVRKESDGSLTYKLPVGASDRWPEEAEDIVVSVRWHQYGCPERGAYTTWVKGEDGEYRQETVRPHLDECTCTSVSPHWGHPVPPAGYIWKVVRVYEPEFRDYPEGKLDKTALPEGWPGDHEHWRPHGTKNKRWNMVYTRKAKLHRAKKLGFDYEFHSRRHWRDWTGEDSE